MIKAARDLEFTLAFEVAENLALFPDLSGDVFRIFLGHAVFKGRALVGGVGIREDFPHGWFDFIDQSGDVAELHVGTGPADRAAGGMAEDDDGLGTSLGCGVFKTAEEVVVKNISRDAGAEDVANALVENDFIGGAGVDAAEHGCEGILAGCGFPSLGLEIAVFAVA